MSCYGRVQATNLSITHRTSLVQRLDLCDWGLTALTHPVFPDQYWDCHPKHKHSTCLRDFFPYPPTRTYSTMAAALAFWDLLGPDTGKWWRFRKPRTNLFDSSWSGYVRRSSWLPEWSSSQQHGHSCNQDELRTRWIKWIGYRLNWLMLANSRLFSVLATESAHLKRRRDILHQRRRPSL